MTGLSDPAATIEPRDGQPHSRLDGIEEHSAPYCATTFGEKVPKDVWPLWIAGLERDDNIRPHRWRNAPILAGAGDHDRRPGGTVGDPRHSDLDTSELQRVVTVDDNGAVNTKVLLIIAHAFYHRLSRPNGPVS
jgi:hypothetical protein